MNARIGNDSLPDRYTSWELERRFKIEDVPEDFVVNRKAKILDRYIDNTRLRLRQSTDAESEEITYKLGHKRIVDPEDFSRMHMTNMHLTADEYGVFAQLPARVIEKTRFSGHIGSVYLSVDRFDDHNTGLLVATVDFKYPETMMGWTPPSWIGDEVTNDVAYTGALLAAE